MKSAILSVMSSLVLITSASAFAGHGSHAYNCSDEDGDNTKLITNVDGQDEQLTVDGVTAAYDASYNPRYNSLSLRYYPQSNSGNVSAYIIDMPLNKGAAKGNLVLDYQGEGDGDAYVRYTCTLAN